MRKRMEPGGSPGLQNRWPANSGRWVRFPSASANRCSSGFAQSLQTAENLGIWDPNGQPKLPLGHFASLRDKFFRRSPSRHQPPESLIEFAVRDVGIWRRSGTSACAHAEPFQDGCCPLRILAGGAERCGSSSRDLGRGLGRSGDRSRSDEARLFRRFRRRHSEGTEGIRSHSRALWRRNFRPARWARLSDS